MRKNGVDVSDTLQTNYLFGWKFLAMECHWISRRYLPKSHQRKQQLSSKAEACL
jgi:hypothetical protein